MLKPPPHEIMYVIGSLNVGGTERHVTDIVPALSAQGYRITIYCLSERGVLADSLAASGVEVIGPPLRIDALSYLGRLGRSFSFGLSVFKLWALMLARRPTIVHCFLPMANMVGITLARLSFIKRVVATRRSLNRYQSKHPFYARIERRLNRHANAIVSNSHASKRELVQEEGVNPKRIVVIHNGIPLSRITTEKPRSEIRKALNIDENALVFVIVANLIGYKGHLDLIEALANVSHSLQKPWLLLVVGRDDGMGPLIRQAVQESGLDKHVRLLGARSDIPELLRAADIAVLCSHEEGFPNAVIEYMASGLPIVVTDVGGTREVVGDGEAGYLVSAKDPQAIGSALLRLANDPQTRQRMGDAGRKRVCEQFTLEACVAEYDLFYRRLLESA